MLDRFRGYEGQRRLLEALQRQELTGGDASIAAEILAVCELEAVSEGTVLITQGGTETDVFLILSGRLSIEVNGMEVAIRQAGTHVGEMAALDPAAPRTATVRALEPTVLGHLTDDAVVSLGERCPSIWRNLAQTLSRRLGDRSRFIRIPNARPHLFIGSSKEMLPIAQGIQAALAHDDLTIRVWTDGVFRASRDSLSSLVDAADQSDFGLLVLGPDDVVVMRGNEMMAARDNVIFELGLFTGAIGRDRTYIIKARGVDITLPSDLLGLTPIEYEAGDLRVELAKPCTEIRRLISELGVK